MNNLLYKSSIRNGLLIGGISAVLTIIYYIINPLLQYTNLVIPILSFIIVIAFLVVLAIDARKKLGGFWTYGQAFISLIITSFFIILIGVIVNFIIVKFVDPTLPTKINDAVQEVTSQRLEKMGMDQAQIDNASKQFTDGEFIAKMQPTILNEIKALGIGLLIYAVIDLIIAACVKKKQPMFAADAFEEPLAPTT